VGGLRGRRESAFGGEKVGRPVQCVNVPIPVVPCAAVFGTPWLARERPLGEATLLSGH